MPVVWTDGGQAHGYVITKISRTGRLPWLFFRYGARLARAWSSAMTEVLGTQAQARRHKRINQTATTVELSIMDIIKS